MLAINFWAIVPIRTLCEVFTSDTTVHSTLCWPDPISQPTGHCGMEGREDEGRAEGRKIGRLGREAREGG